MRKLPKANKEENLYLRILLSYVMITIAAVIVCAIVLSLSFQQILIYKVYSAQEDNLHNATYSLEDTYRSIKTLMLQLYFDADISMLRYLQKPDDTYINSAMKRLSLYSAIVPNIRSIYIYSNASKTFYDIIPYGPERVYSYNDFYDTYVIEKVAGSIKDIPVLYPENRMFPVIDDSNAISQVNGYTYFYVDSMVNDGAIIINVSDNWIQDIIGKYNQQYASSTFLIDKTGNIIFNNNGVKDAEGFLDTKFIISKISQNTQSGYYVTRSGSEQSIVIYTQYNSLSWILVRIIPINDIMSEVRAARSETIIIAIIILVIGGMAAFLLSRRIYKPIDRLVNKIVDYESERSSVLSIKKKEFLKNIVLGVNQPENIQNTELENLGCHLDPNGIFVLLYLTIDGYNDFYSRYNALERDKLKSAIINMTSDLCSTYFVNECLDIDESHILVLVNIPCDCSSDCAELITKLVGDIQIKTKEVVGLSISVSSSPMTESLEQISLMYNYVKKLSLEKFFMGQGSFLLPDKIKKLDFNEYKHPVELERKLTEYLLSGELDKVRQAWEEIAKSLEPFTFYTFRLEIMRLTSNCFTALSLVEKNKGISLPYSFERFVSDVEGLESLTEVQCYFYRFFESVIRDLDENKLNKQNDLIKHVNDIIQKRYRDVNLSLFSIADEIGMSSVYLGRVYKKLTSTSVLDYINGIRIDIAKKFLIETDKTIKDISTEAGYTNIQHFYRVFKKSTGVTPDEFRKKGKSN